MSQSENILVIPRSHMEQCTYRFQGFMPGSRRMLESILDPDRMQFLPRDAMENNPDYKQLIPYVILRYIDNGTPCHPNWDNTGPCLEYVFQYTRGTKSGEARLHAKKSIGIGGHVNSQDVKTSGKALGYAEFYEGLERELSEEIQIDVQHSHPEFRGLVNDESNDVGRVHLGLVFIMDLEKPVAEAKEACMLMTSFMEVGILAIDVDSLETWSQICLEHLFLR
jgi:predicted NUDIX family phosphoesterase